jgi:hypothetical protein
MSKKVYNKKLGGLRKSVGGYKIRLQETALVSNILSSLPIMPTELEHRAEGHYLIEGQTLKDGKF